MRIPNVLSSLVDEGVVERVVRPLMSGKEAQVYLGISRATFWGFVKRYQVPRYHKPLAGKRLFFKRRDLDTARATPVRVDSPGKAAA